MELYEETLSIVLNPPSPPLIFYAVKAKLRVSRPLESASPLWSGLSRRLTTRSSLQAEALERPGRRAAGRSCCECCAAPAGSCELGPGTLVETGVAQLRRSRCQWPETYTL